MQRSGVDAAVWGQISIFETDRTASMEIRDL